MWSELNYPLWELRKLSTTFNLQLFGAGNLNYYWRRGGKVYLLWPPLSFYSSRKICIFTNEGYSSLDRSILQLSRPTSTALLQLLCSSRSLFIQIVHHLDGRALSCFCAAAFGLSKVQREPREREKSQGAGRREWAGESGRMERRKRQWPACIWG